jgi:glycosyltransferase
MKISVITVSYNSAETIADTLRSVAAQQHPDLEHIVIDGGSSDATLSLVAKYGSHVATLVSEPDRGIYDAMNKGLARATGDIVGFLNADDVFADRNALEAIDGAMRDADVAYGDLVYVSARDSGQVVRSWIAGSYSASRLKWGWMPPHPTFYIRRAAFPDLAFDHQLRIAADYGFMLRCLRRSGIRVAYVPKVLVHMRMGGASNRSLRALWRKSREDLIAIRDNGLAGWLTLVAKNLRKLPQFIKR